MIAAFADLSTPLVADACLRLQVPLRAAPPGVRPIAPGMRAAGRVLPARHYGSVDVFLEAFESAGPGDVIVIDNAGRTDEACVGDLAVLEAAAAGLSGMVVWGLHRDTAELVDIGFPVFSCGAYAPGPQRLDDREAEALTSVLIGSETVTRDDAVFADEDGVLFVAHGRVEEVLQTAAAIRHTEREQAERVRAGETLRAQTSFSGYLDRRKDDPDYTFRKHLRRIGGAIEE